MGHGGEGDEEHAYMGVNSWENDCIENDCGNDWGNDCENDAISDMKAAKAAKLGVKRGMECAKGFKHSKLRMLFKCVIHNVRTDDITAARLIQPLSATFESPTRAMCHIRFSTSATPRRLSAMRVPIASAARAPTPPPLSLPEEGTPVPAPTQAPLCTPNDQPVLFNPVTVASPRRSAPKRRRAFDDASQRDFPDMSQDTLALFSNVVREHSNDRTPRRKRRAGAALARASLISTLSASEPLHNPFLDDRLLDADHCQPQSVFSNPSDSFSNMNSVLAGISSAKPTRTIKGYAKWKQSGDMKRLKLRLVSSSQGRKFSLDFEQRALAGRGAFSEVWQVVHRLDGCTYAVKKNITALHTDQDRWNALQEAFALSALQNHPNILRYHDVWFEEKGKYLYIQTEFISGGSLYSQYVQLALPMNANELCALAADISCALCFTHSKGIAHLDVKPDNIFRTERGLGRKSYVIGDFGLACHKDGTDARTTEGDARYLRPEALTGAVFAASDVKTKCNDASDQHDNYFDLRAGDIYSLGASLYELGMGSPLDKKSRRESDDREYAKKMANELKTKCGSDLIARIVEGCLEPEPSRRATAQQVFEICKLKSVDVDDSVVKKIDENIALREKLAKYERFMRNLIGMGEAGREHYRRYRTSAL